MDALEFLMAGREEATRRIISVEGDGREAHHSVEASGELEEGD